MIVLNLIATIVSLIPFATFVGLQLGILASGLVQMELNKLAAQYPLAP